MRSNLRETLERQAAWQRARSTQSWAEKLRRAVIMRRALRTRSRMAEREGFEPSVEGLPLHVISSHADSATLASLRYRAGGR